MTFAGTRLDANRALWSSMTRFTIASPSPVPPCRVVKNGRKSCRRVASSMPTPESSTSISTSSSPPRAAGRTEQRAARGHRLARVQEQVQQRADPLGVGVDLRGISPSSRLTSMLRRPRARAPSRSSVWRMSAPTSVRLERGLGRARQLEQAAARSRPCGRPRPRCRRQASPRLVVRRAGAGRRPRP